VASGELGHAARLLDAVFPGGKGLGVDRSRKQDTLTFLTTMSTIGPICSGRSFPSATRSRPIRRPSCATPHRSLSPSGESGPVGELTIDLEDVDGESAKVADRGIAGPEVVTRQAEAQRLEARELGH
jgi:hypothetical protein